MRRSDWLLGQLPMGMLDDDFFVRYTSIFQEVATSLMENVDNLENIVDVTVAPESMVRWLGSWIGINSIDASLPHELQRRMVRESSDILAWRATRRGLQQFLELMSGAPAEVEENGGVFPEGEAGVRAPFVCMRVASTGHMAETDFLALVQDEIPADVHFELWVGDRLAWPRTTGEPQAVPA